MEWRGRPAERSFGVKLNHLAVAVAISLTLTHVCKSQNCGPSNNPAVAIKGQTLDDSISSIPAACVAFFGAAGMMDGNATAIVGHADSTVLKTAAQASPGKRYAISTSGQGAIWMTFVWLNSYHKAGQTLLVDDGAVTLTVSSTGLIEGRIGSGSSQVFVGSNHHVGIQAWQHIALAWDGESAKLYLNGIREALSPRRFAQSDGLSQPFGAWNTAGVKLDGKVREAKFLPLKDKQDPYEVISQEYGIAFRNRLLSDLATIIAPTLPRDEFVPSLPNLDLFNSPTIASTSILRAAVNALLVNNNQCLESVSINDNEVLDYVYPAFGGDTTGGGRAVTLSCSDGTTRTVENDTLSLYLRLLHGESSGECDVAATTLWAVYRAFGFAPKKLSWSGYLGAGATQVENLAYSHGHVVTEVYVPEAGQFVLQDPFFNLAGVVNDDGTVVYESAVALPCALGTYRCSTDARTYRASQFADAGACFGGSGLCYVFRSGTLRADWNILAIPNGYKRYFRFLLAIPFAESNY
jgi:hypothetical protein